MFSLFPELSSGTNDFDTKENTTVHCDTIEVKNRLKEHRGQTFARARVVVRAELSARTKTEEKYITGRLHKPSRKKKTFF